jgi:general secretion pathway protein G
MVKLRKSEAGFTLLELMVVMIIIGVLAAIAIPAYLTQIKRAKEAVLREDLHVMRQAIDQYTVDKQKAPQSLDDLVQSGYMKSLPTDPLTNRSDTWVTEQSDSYSSVDQTESGGMNNVRSGAGGLATDGSIYSSW